MGLLDTLLGGALGGRSQATAASGTSGGLVTALLVILAGRVMSSAVRGSSPPLNQEPGAPGAPATVGQGNLGGLFGESAGTLGGLFGGSGAAGALGSLLGGEGSLAGGLDELLKRFQESGHDGIAKSWIGSGPNAAITPDQLAQALGPDLLDELAAKTGVPLDKCATMLAGELPDAVDMMSPEGRLPTADEASRWM
jgi:uncharacterized protein YidB (DUF937 family)